MKFEGIACVAGLLAATTLSGDEILARAGTATGLTSYSVPVHFDVHMHRPIGIKTVVDGIAYFKAPGKAAIAITHAPGPLGAFFKGSYTLDMVPQTWPIKYAVTSVSHDESGAYALTASPKNDQAVDKAVFTVSSDYQPLGVHWFYKDGSSIVLTVQNQQVGGYTLPATETISVNLPKYGLDATAKYGDYSLGAPV
ncbi:MAG: hypothetical protein JO199_05005, partial [Candidatus Eremiobacteraeota bacterium]|nr:hypothetical protein [Candidatus Eremiobacteraeota bacterium]